MSAKGLYYQPSPPPQTNDPYAIRQWCEREFVRIANAIQEGRAMFLRLDELKTPLERPQQGTVAYFAANVVGPGLAAGAYEYVGGTWKKL